MKVHIIGLPSAGKTTLASDVAAACGVPHHHLDQLAYTDERWTPRPPADREEMIGRILGEPDFVTEGGFLGWTEPLFAAAERIVWLDPPLRTLVLRHIRRHARHPRALPSLLRFQFLSYVEPPGRGPATDDRDQTRTGIEVALRPWAHKVIRLRRSVTAPALIASLDLRAAT
jgi:hypothetical protein